MQRGSSFLVLLVVLGALSPLVAADHADPKVPVGPALPPAPRTSDPTECLGTPAQPPPGGRQCDPWVDAFGDDMFGPLNMQDQPVLLGGVPLFAVGGEESGPATASTGGVLLAFGDQIVCLDAGNCDFGTVNVTNTIFVNQTVVVGQDLTVGSGDEDDDDTIFFDDGASEYLVWLNTDEDFAVTDDLVVGYEPPVNGTSIQSHTDATIWFGHSGGANIQYDAAIGGFVMSHPIQGVTTDGALAAHKASSDHDGRYYPRTEADAVFAAAAHAHPDSDTLAALSCGASQVAKWTGSAWACADDVDTTYAAGSGLLLAGTTFSLMGCAPGEVLKADTGGGWACGSDAVTSSWSAITGKPAGFADDTDDDVLGGLSCASGEVAKWTGSAWSCSADVDTDTTYSAGSGLTLVGTVFAVADLGITTSMLADAAVSAAKLAVSSVVGGTGGAILDDSITAADLAPDSVGQEELALGAVGGNEIQDGSISASKFAAGAVTGGTLGTILDGSITSIDLASDSIGSSHIVTGGVGASELAAGSVVGGVGGTILDASITSDDIALGTIIASLLAPGSVLGGPGGTIQDDSVTSADLAAGSVGTSEVADGSLLFADIGANGCTTSQVMKRSSTAWVCAADAGSSDADTLDTLDSSQFVRSDASDTFSGTKLTLTGTGGLSVQGASGSDTDTIFFDDGASEWFRWNDALARFELSDDLALFSGLVLNGQILESPSAGSLTFGGVSVCLATGPCATGGGPQLVAPYDIRLLSIGGLFSNTGAGGVGPVSPDVSPVLTPRGSVAFCFTDDNGDGVWTTGEGGYLRMGGDTCTGQSVAANDIRLTAVGPLSAFTQVRVTDSDFANPLTSGTVALAPGLQDATSELAFFDADGDGSWIMSDTMYADVDGNGIVSAGDYRWTAFGANPGGSRVAAGNTDLSLPLTTSGVNRGSHDLDLSAAWWDLNDNGFYRAGEIPYLDLSEGRLV